MLELTLVIDVEEKINFIITIIIIRKYYFASDSDVEVIGNYLNFLEQNLNTLLYRVIMLGDFNVPKYSWLNGTPLRNCYKYNKT
jgi:hypothetical protein